VDNALLFNIREPVGHDTRHEILHISVHRQELVHPSDKHQRTVRMAETEMIILAITVFLLTVAGSIWTYLEVQWAIIAAFMH